jgi:hypothetical protein
VGKLCSRDAANRAFLLCALRERMRLVVSDGFAITWIKWPRRP